VKTIQLGHTDRTVSAMCFGAMMFGTLVPEDRARDLLDHFVERGGTFIDTANNYAVWVGGTGDESETLLGRWFADSGLRDQVCLSTKLGARPAPASASSEQRLGLSPDAIRSQFQGSLDRLGVNSVELLYLHIDDPAVPVADTQQAVAELKQNGFVVALGTSNHTLARMRERDAANAAIGLLAHDATQMRHSYLTPRPDADFTPQIVLDAAMTAYAAEVGTTVCAYSPLLNGALTRHDRELPAEYRHERTDRQVNALTEVGAMHGATPNQVIFAWMLAQDPVVVPVVGASTRAQLDEALDAVDLTLTADDLARLAEARGG
jgi:aryl-alcohol dehydrogenase-like predicted oxidoreductase